MSSLLHEMRPSAVLCVSHRPAFWLSCYKQRSGQEFRLWGLLGEYGCSLGWRYIHWEAMDGFMSPCPSLRFNYPFPKHMQFCITELPVRRQYSELASECGDPRHVLVVCGYWGQGSFTRVIRRLRTAASDLRITAVCGENLAQSLAVRQLAEDDPLITVHGVVNSLAPYLRAAGAVITKPGISTLLEAHAARRKIFMLPGMPVAEAHNAVHAIAHFGAEWFSEAGFHAWLKQPEPHEV
jgi:hypothetical protein